MEILSYFRNPEQDLVKYAEYFNTPIVSPMHLTPRGTNATIATSSKNSTASTIETEKIVKRGSRWQTDQPDQAKGASHPGQLEPHHASGSCLMLLATCNKNNNVTQTLHFEKDMRAKSYDPWSCHYKKQGVKTNKHTHLNFFDFLTDLAYGQFSERSGYYMYHGLSQHSNNHQTNRSQFSND